MRQISAHYCLLPDGSLAKMPVISVDENGVINEVKLLGDGFIEEHGVELYGGVLIPGFIEDFRDVIFGNDVADFSKRVNRMFAKGSLRYLCNSENTIFPKPFKGVVFYDNSNKAIERIRKMPDRSTWDEIQRWNPEGNKNIIQLIHNYSIGMRDAIPEELKWGSLEVGANPGILLVKGLDYNGMKLQENTTIKVIIL